MYLPLPTERTEGRETKACAVWSKSNYLFYCCFTSHYLRYYMQTTICTLEKAHEYIHTQFEATTHWVEMNGMYWELEKDMHHIIDRISASVREETLKEVRGMIEELERDYRPMTINQAFLEELLSALQKLSD